MQMRLRRISFADRFPSATCTVVINDETMKTVDKRSIYNEDLYRIEFVSIKWR